jgi:Tfp pilus assembly protein PilX
MAKWLDKYEQGGLVLKKKTKDNYGKRPNPNDVQASVGPDFVGLGYNTKGRNYSPAWGGQFAVGGSLPGAVGFTYARTQDPAPSNGKYAKKTLASAQDGKQMPKAYWASNNERDAYRKNLKAAAEAALTNNASDEDLLINTSYHDMNSGNNCISGVCGLNRKAGLTYNAPTDNDRFLSGEKFAQAVAKGDEDYYQVSGNFQPGDHLQYRHKEGSSSHNKIIYDIQVDDKGEKMYKVIDNAGGKDMRSRDYTEVELKELVEKGGGGYDKVNIYRPGYNLDKPLLDKEREAKTSPEARAALAERKNIQEWDASHNPGFDYSIRPESEYYNKQPEGMKKFIDFANDDAKVTALAKKLNVGKDIIHDQLLNTFGELGQENEWDDPWFGGDLSKGISPIPIPFESTMEKVLNAVGGGKGWSVGPGQIKFNTLDPELRKQFGINKPKDLHDFDKVIPLMTAINVKNKKWMENQGDALSTKLIGTPGVSADEIKYGIDRWVPYAYQGLPTDPVAAVRRDAQENVNSYRMSTKDREEYINNYIKKNINPDKLKTFDEGSYAGRVYDLIDKNLSRTMPAQNYEQYNELMPVTVKSKKKMQNGGEMKFYQEGLDFKPKTISKNGSVIKDDRGQWAHPGEITEIDSNEITMEGVPYDVIGISDEGDIKDMKPGKNYKFKGSKVTEYPKGGWLNKYK